MAKAAKEREAHLKRLSEIHIPSGSYQIIVHLIEVARLRAGGDGTASPLVFVRVGDGKAPGRSKHSKVMKNRTSCVFDTTFYFDCDDYDANMVKNETVTAEVFDAGGIVSNNKIIGSFQVIARGSCASVGCGGRHARVPFAAQLAGSVPARAPTARGHACSCLCALGHRRARHATARRSTWQVGMSDIYYRDGHELYRQWVGLVHVGKNDADDADGEDESASLCQGYLRLSITVLGPAAAHPLAPSRPPAPSPFCWCLVSQSVALGVLELRAVRRLRITRLAVPTNVGRSAAAAQSNRQAEGAQFGAGARGGGFGHRGQGG